MITQDKLERIEKYVDAQVKRYRLPGTAVTVVHGDQVVMAKGLGSTRLSGGEPVTPDTPFQVGSVTKPMTATAVLQLHERGLIELDVPVRQYIPYFRLADENAAAQMTVRHLLTQTTGIPNGAWKIGLDQPEIRTSLEKSVQAMAVVKPVAPPGEKWQRSNLNYNVLGLLVEIVSGQPYARYMLEYLFVPLGMERSNFTLEEVHRYGYAHPCIKRYGKWVEIEPTTEPWCAPSGLALFASANDLARFASATLGHGPVKLLKPETRTDAQSGGVAVGLRDAKYALGWMHANFHGSRIVFHPGTAAGSNAIVALLPDEQWAVTVVTTNGGQEAEWIGLGMLRILKGLEPEGTTYTPDIFGIASKIFRGLTAVGALLLAGVVVWALLAGGALGWGAASAWTVGTLLWVLLAVTVRRSPMVPVPVPLNVGAGGWGIELVVAWWSVLIGLAAWGVFGLLGASRMLG
jgi:CubicO group peptidase (beta-lactamase class C family)